MSDTITKWHEMQDENKEIVHADETAKYIFLLDFSSLCNEENKWNPDSESCEAFLYGAGHKVNDCEWMVTNEKTIEYGN